MATNIDAEWAFFMQNAASITSKMSAPSPSAFGGAGGPASSGSSSSTGAPLEEHPVPASNIYVSTMVVLAYLSAEIDMKTAIPLLESKVGQESPEGLSIVSFKVRKDPSADAAPSKAKQTGFWYSRPFVISLGGAMAAPPPSTSGLPKAGKVPAGQSPRATATLFDEGIIHLTGIKKLEDAHKAAAFVVKLLDPSGDLSTVRLDTGLLNAQFATPFNLDRQMLYGILTRSLGIQAVFDPLNFQGVKAKLFWNASRTGRCTCSPADGGPCKLNMKPAVRKCCVVTASIFRTGKVNIMGAKSMDQVYQVANLINSVLQTHREALSGRSGNA